MQCHVFSTFFANVRGGGLSGRHMCRRRDYPAVTGRHVGGRRDYPAVTGVTWEGGGDLMPCRGEEVLFG